MHLYTVPEVAKRLRVRAARVRGWIASGALSAFNLGTDAAPKYRISDEQIETLLKTMQVTRQQAHKRLVRKPPKIDYFPD